MANNSLKSKKEIDSLFQIGKSSFVYPIKAVYLIKLEENTQKLKYSVTVSKRLFKKAVHRNKIKRRMKEAVRLQEITTAEKEISSIMFIYVSKEILPYDTILKAIKSIIKRLKLN